jgi:hypothetical protein
VLTELISSGRVVDTNVYRNYFYETAQSYSERGWFIVGDAGDTVDPLYSTGMAMTSIQVKQVAALIDADRRGTLTREYVRDLEAVYKTIRDALQLEISTLYEVMHDPFQAHLRMHCASAVYFYVLLPAWLAGYITDPAGAKVLLGILNDSAPRYESLKSLLPIASRRLGPLPATAIKNLYGTTVNWSLTGPDERMMPRDLARCARLFARLRFQVLRQSGWHRWPTHLSLCVSDLLRSVIFGVALRRRALKDLRLVRTIVGVRPPSAERRADVDCAGLAEGPDPTTCPHTA